MKPPRPAAGSRRHPPVLRSRRQVQFPPGRFFCFFGERCLPDGEQQYSVLQQAGDCRYSQFRYRKTGVLLRQTGGRLEPVKALLRQLYSVKARAEAELNSCIAGAKAEFKSLPESQQTQARKISIVLARSGRLYAMQASYDKEVASIVGQMSPF